MLVLACIGVLQLAWGATEYLPLDIMVKFYLESRREVKFEFYIPDLIKQDNDWASFEFFPVNLPKEQLIGDCYVILFDSESFDDYYSEGNKIQLDSELGGSVDVIDCEVSTKGRFSVYSMKRPLKLRDKFDIKLKKGKVYAVRWRIGNLLQGEMIEASGKTGIEYFVLKEDYEDRNDDETGVFGPRSFASQQPVDPPFGMTPENYEWSLLVENYFIGKPFEPETFYVSDPEGKSAYLDLPEAQLN